MNCALRNFFAVLLLLQTSALAVAVILFLQSNAIAAGVPTPSTFEQLLQHKSPDMCKSLKREMRKYASAHYPYKYYYPLITLSVEYQSNCLFDAIGSAKKFIFVPPITTQRAAAEGYSKGVQRVLRAYRHPATADSGEYDAWPQAVRNAVIAGFASYRFPDILLRIVAKDCYLPQMKGVIEWLMSKGANPNLELNDGTSSPVPGTNLRRMHKVSARDMIAKSCPGFLKLVGK
jgi:hypothetical protein